MKKTKIFQINCTIDGYCLSLKLPNHIYADYEKALRTKEGLSTLCRIFELYSKFSDFHRMDFQQLIFEYPNVMHTMCDVHRMIWAYKTIKDETEDG